MDRKAYWNDKYAEYWRFRVAEAAESGEASSLVAGDAKTEGDEIYEEVFRTYPFVSGTILDVGCAWGRTFPLFHAHHLRVSGVDISDTMIDQCRDAWSGKANIDVIETAEAEALPFPDQAFDNVACLAVFDATFQEKALDSFFRVLKPGGHLYLTGKNMRYHIDDKLAFDAECGALARDIRTISRTFRLCLNNCVQGGTICWAAISLNVGAILQLSNITQRRLPHSMSFS